MSNDQPLLDFRYLDSDRVRSLLSQLARGYPDRYESVAESSGRAGLKAVFEFGTEEMRSAAESRAVHHYQYTLLESLLDESSRLARIPDDIGSNDLGTIDDGTVIRAVGKLRVMDPKKLVFAFDNIGGLFQLMSTLGRQNAQAPKAQPKSKNQIYQELGVSERDLKGFATLLGTIFGERERFRLLPWMDHPGCYVGGALTRSFATGDEDAVFAGGAYSLEGDWTVLGIATKLHATQQESNDSSLETLALSVLEALGALNNVVSPVTRDIVTVVPIAIFREI